MKKFFNKTLLGKYTLACCAACVAVPALAGSYNSNLVSNGDAESLTSGVTGTQFPGWISDKNVTIEPYSSATGFPAPSSTDSPTRGNNFFYGGNVTSAIAKQAVDLSFASASDIDAGKVAFTLSAWLGGYDTQSDYATVAVVFYDAQGLVLNTVSIGPVSTADRASKTSLLQRTTSGILPSKTRSAVVEMHFTRQAGTANDGYIDDVSLTLTDTTSSACNADATLVRYDYLGACGLTKTSSFTLDKASDVSRIRIWYNTNVGGDSLKVNITGANGYAWSGQSTKGGCDTYQKNWCEGIVTLNTQWAAGNYTLAIDSVSMCSNPSGATTLLVYGCPTSTPSVLPIDQWIDGFDITIDQNNVDVFLPSPTFTDNYYRLQRSYNPFGDADYLDFKAAILRAGVGAVRVEHLNINGVEHWVDLSIDVNRSDLPMKISALAPGTPPTAMPRWNGNFPDVDFSLTTADIYGPPARIVLFDVGISGGLYDVNFLLTPATEFVLSTLTDKGYAHFLPTRTAPVLAVGSDSAVQPNTLPTGALNLPGVAFQRPLALFGWTGGEGEQEVLLTYATGSQVQRMQARDGVLVGSYSPPPSGAVAKLLPTQLTTITPKGALPFWGKPSLDESLNSCIDEKTKVQTGFKADNELSQQLVDLVITIVGHDKLKLSSPTLEKIRTAMADSKDSVMELMANGKTDSETLAVFVSSTILKNVTPKEHEYIIEQQWGNKIPDHAKTVAGTSGSAAETNYKLAAQALAEGLASTFFPAYTSAVKTVIQTAKYTNDTLADQAFQELYKSYKSNNGNWADVLTVLSLGTNKFAEQKVRAILQNQGKASDPDKVLAYLQKKMQSLYAQEPQAEKEREKLNRAKEDFKSLDSDAKAALKKLVGSEDNNCDLFQKYLDYVASAQLDLSNSMGDCKSIRPTKLDIEKQAYLLARTTRLSSGTYTERQTSYQNAKLGWLKVAGCLRYEDVRKNVCSDVAKEGANTPETTKVELGQVSGNFVFEYETYNAEDRMIVAYENKLLFDSGCVGTNGWKSTTLPYAGKSSQILVRVEPNCKGSSDTQWLFKASCPTIK
ncbi:MAG: hypothetical protein NTV00_02570 [Methylococcales bacterium]|nr:hypothetical protein [Methylococcales bacterium]